RAPASWGDGRLALPRPRPHGGRACRRRVRSRELGESGIHRQGGWCPGGGARGFEVERIGRRGGCVGGGMRLHGHRRATAAPLDLGRRVMSRQIPRSQGRTLFGCDPVTYERARPGYPGRVYELLVERCGLAGGCRTIEVGAGSGQATRRLVELGARPLVAVEPDRGFAAALESLARSSRGAVVPVFASFESATVEEGAFDLAICATSFHWLDREIGPPKLGACL